MNKPPALSARQAEAAAALNRWDRIGIGVRCAYNPGCPCVLLHYLAAGRRVVATGARTEQQVHQRTLSLLLQVAHDEALPWFWRSVSLEHVAYPLARLQSLLKTSDPLAVSAVDSAVQAALDVLGSAPRR